MRAWCTLTRRCGRSPHSGTPWQLLHCCAHRDTVCVRLWARQYQAQRDDRETPGPATLWVEGRQQHLAVDVLPAGRRLPLAADMC